MREAAHPGRIAAFPAQVLSLEATQALGRPSCDTTGGGRAIQVTEEYDEGADHPRARIARDRVRR